MGYKKLDKKVFDYLDMPENVKEAFDKYNEDEMGHAKSGLVNIDVYQECYDGTEDYVKVKDGEVLWTDDEEGSTMLLIRGNDIIGDWLLDNGATPWEEVIINNPR